MLNLIMTKNRTRKTQLRTLFGTSFRKFEGSLSGSFLLLLLLFFLFYLARQSVFICRQIILGLVLPSNTAVYPAHRLPHVRLSRERPS